MSDPKKTAGAGRAVEATARRLARTRREEAAGTVHKQADMTGDMDEKLGSDKDKPLPV